jgi:DNA repair photolyase
MTEDTIKRFNGKAIKMPKGKAGEYAKYSCNFYVGCSNGCTYCYLRKPPLRKACGGSVPTLAKCFKDENHALAVFEKELKANLPELQKHGLFFTFTSDPFLPEPMDLSGVAVGRCLSNNIRVKMLTKRADWCDYIISQPFSGKEKKLVAFGFTLTGRDDLEPNASTNAERIEAMRKLHDAGFKTWASIEPIIDFESSYEMILNTMGFCDLYKIGLQSGAKYDRENTADFVSLLLNFIRNNYYFKDSLLKAAGINREDLPANCVNSDYNMFNN